MSHTVLQSYYAELESHNISHILTLIFKAILGVTAPCHYLVIEEEVHEARDVFGKLCELPDRLHGGALTAVEHMDTNFLVGRGAIELVPHQAVLSLPQRVHVVDHKRLSKRRNSTVKPNESEIQL